MANDINVAFVKHDTGYDLRVKNSMVYTIFMIVKVKRDCHSTLVPANHVEPLDEKKEEKEDEMTVVEYFQAVIEPSKEDDDHKLAIRFQWDPEQNYKYNYYYKYMYNPIDTKPDDYLYTLPLNGKFKCSQTHNGDISHHGDLAYCVDFKCPEGTPVYAMRDGIVAETEQRFKEGRMDKKLFKKWNFIRIRHDDNTFTEYGHLKHNGVLVKIGDKVSAGDHIGFSGNTGYSQGPHLHVALNRVHMDLSDSFDKMTAKVESLFFEFANAEGKGFVPRQDEMVTSFATYTKNNELKNKIDRITK